MRPRAWLIKVYRAAVDSFLPTPGLSTMGIKRGDVRRSQDELDPDVARVLRKMDAGIEPELVDYSARVYRLTQTSRRIAATLVCHYGNLHPDDLGEQALRRTLEELADGEEDGSVPELAMLDATPASLQDAVKAVMQTNQHFVLAFNQLLYTATEDPDRYRSYWPTCVEDLGQLPTLDRFPMDLATGRSGEVMKAAAAEMKEFYEHPVSLPPNRDLLQAKRDRLLQMERATSHRVLRTARLAVGDEGLSRILHAHAGLEQGAEPGLCNPSAPSLTDAFAAQLDTNTFQGPRVRRFCNEVLSGTTDPWPQAVADIAALASGALGSKLGYGRGPDLH